MTVFDYIKDKILVIIGNLSGMLALTAFLLAVGNPAEDCLLIMTVWAVVLVLYLVIMFTRRKKYFDRLDEILDGLDKRYLVAEVMEPSYHLEDKLYREILRRSNKSVIEKIYQLEEEQQDYKEYIESWIHEVKAPITAMNLICENNRDESKRKLLAELGKLENYVEMALFYARSEAVYKDYFIHRIDLKQVLLEVVIRNKQYLIQNGMQVNLEFEEAFVFSDEKWVIFILNQILLNSVKYKKGNNGIVEIIAEEVPNALKLVIKDDGMGIRENELGRIFEKGFTGTNGRIEGEKSTGIGLYLCKKLCGKLEIGMEAESVEGEYTKTILTFPISNYLSKM